VCLPAALPDLDPRVRASLIVCLEMARRMVPGGDQVHLHPDASAQERNELQRVLAWSR
jgi:hypothetical protein